MGTLDPFSHIDPSQIISKYDDWILFTLLIFFFWSVIGIALRKKFEDSRHLRVMVTSIALMFAVGTYYSIYKGWLNFNFQSLGFFGVVFIFIIIFFILYGLFRGYGISLAKSFFLSYVLFYMSLWALSPNIFHTIADFSPLINLILLILFLYSLFKTISGFFSLSKEDPSNLSEELYGYSQKNNKQNREEKAELKYESKNIKKKTEKATKKEYKSIDEIYNKINEIRKMLGEKGNSLNKNDLQNISKDLTEIGSQEKILYKNLRYVNNHVYHYGKKHKKDIKELEIRFHQASNIHQRSELAKEIEYQKLMIKSLKFLEQYENKIIEMLKTFNQLLSRSIETLKRHYPKDALHYLEKSQMVLREIRYIYKKEKFIEEDLIHYDKKLIKNIQNR